MKYNEVELTFKNQEKKGELKTKTGFNNENLRKNTGKVVHEVQ